MTTDTLQATTAPGPKRKPRLDPVSGPDFICAGLQKGGTQWLYDQLQHHRDFWMPPYKELHYFDRQFPYEKLAKAARAYLERPERVARRRDRRGDRKVTPRGAAFFKLVAEFDAPSGDLDAYEKLFEPKGRLLSGDVTPGYSTLDHDTVSALARRFDRAKAILMLREPVSRVWSHWRMANSDQPASALLDVVAFGAFLDRPDVVARSYPSRIAQSWSAAFGERFRFFFLDDVAARPDETRSDILRFLGADPRRPSPVKPDFNRKAKEIRVDRTEPVKALLRERFAAERRICAETFGGAASAWPDAAY